MYVYYEHFKTAHGKIVASDVVVSSVEGSNKINFKNPANVIINDICRALFKSVPLADRNYNPDSHVWSFQGDYSGILDVLQNSLKGKAVSFFEVEDLVDQLTKTGHIRAGTKKAPRPEDFFYSPPSSSSAPETKSSVAPKLSKLLEIKLEDLASAEASALKKLYRQAALKYQPDRNSGDGSKMSELNSLWRIYNA